MKSSHSSARRSPNHPSHKSSRDRALFRRLLVESLEERRVLATLTWVGDVPGAGNNVLWGANNAGNTNWKDEADADALPADGDTLVFDGSGATFALTNDIANLDNLTLQFTDAVAGDYSIAGNTIGLAAAGITSNVTAGAGVTITAALELDAAAVSVTSAAGELALGGGISGAATLNVLAGGGTVSLGGGVDVGAVSSAEDISVSGLIETTGNQSYSGIVTLTGTTEFRATGVAAALTFTGQILAGANDLTLTAREIDLPTAASDRVAGVASITLQPEADATPINVGAAADAGAASLDITEDDIAALANGFAQVTIGRAAGTATITVAAAASFSDALTLRAAGMGGAIVVNGQLDTKADSDAGAIVLDGPGSTTTLNADIVTAGAPITISDAIILGAAAIRLDTTNGGAVAAGANITLNGPGTINDDVAGTSTLTLRAGAGDIVVDGAVGASVAVAGITIVSARHVRFNATLRTTGNVIQQAGTGETEFNGTLATGIGGELDIVTDAILLDAAAVVTAGNVTLTAQNAITLNAPLNAGAGEIVIATNQDGADAQNFQMNAGSSIVTTNNTAMAVSITVNAATGLGNANIRGIAAGTTAGPAGGRITIAANAGAIVDSDAAAAVNLTAGNAVLTAAGGIGTVSEPLETLLGRLAANSGSPIHIDEADALTIGGIAGGLGITTSADDVRLTVGGDLAIDDDISLGAANLLLDVAGNVSQSAGDTIAAVGLALDVTGTTTLTEANSVATLAADTDGTIDYTDANGLIVGAVTVLGDTITGLTTSGDDVRLTAGGDLVIDEDIDLGAGNLLLDVAGNLSQNAGDTISVNGLALTVDGTTALRQANSLVRFAANNGGTIDISTTAGLPIGSVTVLGTTVTGVTTSGDDVRITSGADLEIDAEIDVAGGDLLLEVMGHVTQTAGSTITAGGLSLSVTGTTTLTQANSVATLAASNGGAIDYRDSNSLTVGAVTVLTTTITGLTSSNDDVRLTAGGDLVIDADVILGGGNLLLDVAGNVSQNAGDTIAANGLALDVDGTTTLTEANNVEFLAAANDGTIDYHDTNSLTIAAVTVLTTTITGLTTSSDDVRITAAGVLLIDEDVNLVGGDLLLDVAGNVSQNASDTITANGLALVVDGATTLTQANNVAVIAANNGGTIDYRDSNSLTVGAVTVLTTTITGLSTSDDEVRLTVGTIAGHDLAIVQPINVNPTAAAGGDLLLDVGGSVTQTAPGTIAAEGLALLVDGSTTLTLAGNDVDLLAADNGDEICLVDADDVEVNAVTVVGVTVTGVQTDDADIEIVAGTSTVLVQTLSAGTADVRLVAGTTVSQLAGGNILGNELGVRAGTGIGLSAAIANNDVNELAAFSSAGAIAYGDRDDLEIASLTAGACGFLATVGVSALDGDVSIEVQDTAVAGENLTVADDVLAGSLPTDNNRSLTLRSGDNLTINAGVNVLATGSVLIAADTHSPLADAGTGATVTILGTTGKIAGDLAAGNDVTITLGGDNDTVFLAPDRFDVNAGPDAVPAYASNQMLVSLGGGDDLLTLDYSENFGWSVPKMELTIAAGTGSDTLDIDQSDDTRARKRQFVYAAGEPADGTATNFTSDVQSPGGTFDNNDNLCVMIRQMDGYLVRAGSASLDQTILIGNQAAENTIAVGDIDGSLPAIIDFPAGGDRARFGVSGSELLRSIGGGQRDSIVHGVTPASGVTRTILEGQGSTTVGDGELLLGAANIVNLFFGAGGVTLIGEPTVVMPELGIGLDPERARLVGGAGDGAFGDFYLADHRRVINADGTAAAPLKVVGGDFRDLEMGARSTAVSFGANDRAKAGGSVAGSGPVSIFMNGQINVILWLQARFPGLTELGNVTGSGATSGSAESLVALFNHSFLTCDGQAQTTIDQGSSGGGGGGGGGLLPTNVNAAVSGNKLTLTGGDAINDIVITLGISGPNSARIEGRNGTTINGLGIQDFTGLSKGILAKLAGGADRVLVEGSGFTPLVRIEGGSGNDDYSLKMTGASLQIVESSGWDRLNLAELSTKAILSLSSTSTQSFGASSKLKISGTLEDLVGTAFHDTLTGNKAANNIFGLAGNDTIYGKDGNDYLDGGDGNDTLRGENHNDRLRGGNDNDKIYGGSGHDIVLGELGSDELRGDAGRDLLIGGLGLDVLYGGNDEDIVTGGTTSHDANDTALKALLAEWIKSGSTSSRANKLRTGQTAGNFALNLSEVQLDGQIDSLRGEGSNDWLLAPLTDNDTLVSVTSGDIVDR
jgi:hypothetical protein